MLISALCDYYDVLEKRGKLPPDGYEELGISYVVCLDEDGSITGIIDRRIRETEEKKGKIKETFTPKQYMLPERPRTTSVSAHYVEARGGYLFGLEYRRGKEGEKGFLSQESEGPTEKKRQKLALQHQSFVQEVKTDFGAIKDPSPLVQSYIRFAENWNPGKEIENSYLLSLGKDLNTAKFAFCLSGHPETMLQDDPGVASFWERKQAAEEENDLSSECQDAVSGEVLPIARTHATLVSGKGIGVAKAGINPSLVNFKPESFLSYGHKQGENACISTVTMKKYTKALNWLLMNPDHHSYLDGLTLVYWASDDNEADDAVMQMLLSSNDDSVQAEEMEQELNHLVMDAGDVNVSAERLAFLRQNISLDTDYYIAALAPNSSRIQIKFIYRQQFGRLLYNIARYQTDMKVVGSHGTVPLWRLKKELVPPKSSHPEQLDAPFLAVLKCILQGTNYPAWLMAEVIRRVKTDRDDTPAGGEKPEVSKKPEKTSGSNTRVKRLNVVRAGTIKACLVRQTKEDIKMALDRDNENPAYLCGRLFAVLQKIQEDSVYPQKLNRTISDSYFSAATTNPSAVMPKLINLSRHHMSKLRRSHPDWAAHDASQMDDIINKLGTSFPGTLGLYEQGRFILGYYQQNASRYESKKGD